MANRFEELHADVDWWDEDRRIDAVITTADGQTPLHIFGVLTSFMIRDGWLWLERRDSGNQILIPASNVRMIELRPDPQYRSHDPNQQGTQDEPTD